MTAADTLRSFSRRNQYGWRALKRWEGLDDSKRHELERRYKRHVAACQKMELEPDPNWVIEAVLDA